MIMAIITLNHIFFKDAAESMSKHGYTSVQIKSVTDCMGCEFDNMIIDVNHPDKSDLIDAVKVRIKPVER